MPTTLALLLALQSASGAGVDSEPNNAPPPALRIERPEGQVALLVPRDEKLVFRAHVGVGFLEASVGKVTLKSRVDPYRRSILLGGKKDDDGPQPETARITAHAAGDYAFYSMDATIETLVLPQEWPSTVYRYISGGSDPKRRESLLGVRDGVTATSFRQDTHKGAPPGTRIWKAPKEREIPEGSVDMLSAVFLVRTLIQEEHQVLRFPLLDKLRVWQMRVRRGQRGKVETGAGTFDAVEILLEPDFYPGEEIENEKKERFEGLFGIHGSIHLWVDRKLGIPVRIQGDLPIGPITLKIDVVLESYEGTPAAFAPIG
jgi:hypothetical protein